MNHLEKAKELILLHGKETANKIVDSVLTELQSNWNQERIDFYLDVKNTIKNIVLVPQS